MVFLKAVNVAWKNKVKIKALKPALTEAEYINVQTYIASGNIALETRNTKKEIESEIEEIISERFGVSTCAIAKTKPSLSALLKTCHIVKHTPKTQNDTSV